MLTVAEGKRLKVLIRKLVEAEEAFARSYASEGAEEIKEEARKARKKVEAKINKLMEKK